MPHTPYCWQPRWFDIAWLTTRHAQAWLYRSQSATDNEVIIAFRGTDNVSRVHKLSLPTRITMTCKLHIGVRLCLADTPPIQSIGLKDWKVNLRVCPEKLPSWDSPDQLIDVRRGLMSPE